MKDEVIDFCDINSILLDNKNASIDCDCPPPYNDDARYGSLHRKQPLSKSLVPFTDEMARRLIYIRSKVVQGMNTTVYISLITH